MLKQKFASTDKLYLEVDMDDPSVNMKMLQLSMLKGKKLSDFFSDSDYSKLNDFFRDTIKMPLTFLGEGLSTSNGDLWLRQRRLMQPAFHHQQIQDFAAIINEETATFINRLKKFAPGDVIDITHQLLELTIRIISRTMFDIRFGAEINEMVRALEELAAYAVSWMKSPVKLPLVLPTPANRAYKNNCAVFDKMIYRVIDRRKEEQALNGPKSSAGLPDLLLCFREQKYCYCLQCGTFFLKNPYFDQPVANTMLQGIFLVCIAHSFQ
ncbi:MAG: cytochrome P450 [Chitinophagaceae bacterium]|nr:cytochrome P450 [Chitinophagaceae bacterium]